MFQKLSETNQQPQTPKEIVHDYLRIMLGCLLIAIGVYFIQFQNEFIISSVTGLSILISRATNYAVSKSLVNFIINSSLLVVGYIMLGKEFTVRTTFASVFFATSLLVLDILFPLPDGVPLTNEPFLELAFGVIVPAIGSAILFNVRASSGGTDIVAMILRKFTDLNIGSALILIDMVLVLSTFFIYQDIKKGMLCVLGLMLKAVAIDYVFENFKTNKCFNIITTKPKEIAQAIIDMGRSATIFRGEGAYTHKAVDIVVCIVSRQQAVKLRTITKVVDPNSFCYITNTMDIMGKGFKYYH